MKSFVASLHNATADRGAGASRVPLARVLLFFLPLVLSTAFAAGPPPAIVDRSYAAANDVTWHELGRDENDSMPIGNGDLAANVWTEQNGDLVLLVAKSDAWTEHGKLVKLGRVRVHVTPNPFTDAADFRQTLRLEDGSVEVSGNGGTLRVWVDANRPVLHVEAVLAQPVLLRAGLELWRGAIRIAYLRLRKSGLAEFGDETLPVDFAADTVLPRRPQPRGVVPLQRAKHLSLHSDAATPGDAALKVSRSAAAPLLWRAVEGPGLVPDGDRALKSAVAARTQRLDLVALTTPQAASPQAWQAALTALDQRVSAVPIAAARAAHVAWWQSSGTEAGFTSPEHPDAEQVSQGYILQRYMMAASSRGAYPAKFNGGLFTVGHDLPEGTRPLASSTTPITEHGAALIGTRTTGCSTGR